MNYQSYEAFYGTVALYGTVSELRSLIRKTFRTCSWVSSRIKFGAFQHPLVRSLQLTLAPFTMSQILRGTTSSAHTVSDSNRNNLNPALSPQKHLPQRQHPKQPQTYSTKNSDKNVSQGDDNTPVDHPISVSPIPTY